MAIEIHVGGVNKTIDNAEFKIAGVWKTPDKVSIKVGGVWKEVWSASSLAVSPVGGGVYRSAFEVNAYSGVQFNSNGTEYWTALSGGALFNNNKGAWLDLGTAAEVWVQFVVTSGSFNSINPGTGRLQLSTTRSCRIVDTSTAGGAVTCSFTANFYDAASGGNLLGSADYTLSALSTL